MLLKGVFLKTCSTSIGLGENYKLMSNRILTYA